MASKMAWKIKKRLPSSPIPKPRQGFTLDENREGMDNNELGRYVEKLSRKVCWNAQTAVAREEPSKSAPRRRRKLDQRL
jgi:hypothetical protein